MFIIVAAVKLPYGEDFNEWLAANSKCTSFFTFMLLFLFTEIIFYDLNLELALDFFNEIRLIWDIIVEAGYVDEGPGKGFPLGFEYRWADNRSRSPITCSGPQYIQYVIDWIDAEINNEALFPTLPCNVDFTS